MCGIVHYIQWGDHANGNVPAYHQMFCALSPLAQCSLGYIVDVQWHRNINGVYT